MGRFRRIAHLFVAAGVVLGTAFNLTPSSEFTKIDVPGATHTEAQGINAQGDIVGYYADTGGTHGFLLRNGRFTTIDAPGARSTMVQGINPRGEIVGMYSAGEPPSRHPFLLRDGVFTTIGDEFGEFLWLYSVGINAQGDVVASAVTEGYLFSGGAYTRISVPGDYQVYHPCCAGTFAAGINPQGEIVGSYTTFSPSSPAIGRLQHGFLLSGDAYTTIDVPGAFGTYAQGINAVGEIVGYYFADYAASSPNSPRGFVLSHGAFTTIDVPGATATRALGINSAGDIVGTYSGPDGTHGFLFRK